ncbi:MAG: hypothetical protein P4L66_14875 [Acetobacteraceae bacterium]|nr:hypothetical protein [Acetobacteraceae bacterium]
MTAVGQGSTGSSSATVGGGGGGVVGPQNPVVLNVTTLTTNAAANSALSVIASTPTQNTTVYGGSAPASDGSQNSTIPAADSAVWVSNTSPVTLTNIAGTTNQVVYAGIGALNMTDVGQSDTIVAGGGNNTVSFSPSSMGSTFIGDGNNAISVAGAAGWVTSIFGTKSSADTIIGVPGGASGIYYASSAASSAFIDPGAHNATIVGTAGGIVNVSSVFGGIAFTGQLTVQNGTGSFTGGTAGGNVMESSTVGGTTLIGGGGGDVLTAQGIQDVLKAGPGGLGNVTLQGANTLGGDSFYAGATGTDVMYASTLAGSSLLLGDTFYASTSTATSTNPGVLYNGVTFEGAFIDLHTNAAGATTNTTASTVVGSGVGAAQFATIADFVAGKDKLVLTETAGESQTIGSTTVNGVAATTVTLGNGSVFTFLNAPHLSTSDIVIKTPSA